MRPELVVVCDVFPNAGTQLFGGIVLADVYIFGFKAAEPALNDDVVHPTGLAVHTLPYAQRAQKVLVLIACELAALVGID